MLLLACLVQSCMLCVAALGNNWGSCSMQHVSHDLVVSVPTLCGVYGVTCCQCWQPQGSIAFAGKASFYWIVMFVIVDSWPIPNTLLKTLLARLDKHMPVRFKSQLAA